jgi:lipopolysaccharide export system permease protein
MRLIDGYIFRQMLGPTLLATAALIALAVLSQSLSALGVVVDERQNLAVFAKVIALAMPQLIVLILPVGVLIGALVALNRLHTDQEIVICQSAGVSRRRIMAPGFELAGGVVIVSLALSLWIQPLCYRALRDTLDAVRADLAASLIKPGRFSHPAAGLTVYAQSVSDDGTIHNLFINRVTKAGRDITVTAREGRFERRAGAPMLVMRQGANQEFSPAGILNYLSFDEYVFDLSPVLAMGPHERYKLSDRYPRELFFPDTTDPWARANVDRLAAEGHARIADALYNIAFAAMAFAGVIGGGYRRRGYGGRIAAVAAAALLARTLGFAAEAAAAKAPGFNLAQYGVPILATALALAVLYAPPRRTSRGAPDADATILDAFAPAAA